MRVSLDPDWDLISVRTLLGFVLLGAGLLKALHLGSPHVVATMAWDIVGGHRELLLAAASAEAFLGCCLLVDLWVRPIVACAIVAFLALAVLIGADTAEHGERACGCMGEIGLTGLLAIARNVVLALAALFVLIRTRRARERVVG